MDKAREELDRIEGMPEYQDIIDNTRENIEFGIRNTIKTVVVNDGNFMKAISELERYQTLLKALDMVGSGSGGGGGGAAKKAGGYF